jgi:hypothetical protein
MEEIGILSNNRLKTLYCLLIIKIKDLYTLFIKFIISFILFINLRYDY